MKRLITLALTILALAGCGNGVPPPGPTPPPRLFDGRTAYCVQSLPQTIWPYRVVKGKWVAAAPNYAELDQERDAGFTCVRLPIIPWWTAVNADGTWNFGSATTGLDGLYIALESRNLTPVFTEENPRSAADYGMITAYLLVAADRYSLAKLELGNEADTSPAPGWFEPLSAAEYWTIVKPWAQAWRSGAPTSEILTGGSASFDFADGSYPGWQQPLINAIEGDPDGDQFKSGLINGIGMHPYGEHPDGGSGRGDLYTDLSTLKAMLPANVAIDLTEYGAPNPPPDQVTSWLQDAGDVGIPMFTWFTIRDIAGNQPFGLLNADLSRKSPDAYAAAQAVLAPSSSPTS